jgi:hypothetical protein
MPLENAYSSSLRQNHTITVKVGLKAPDFTDFQAALAPKQGLWAPERFTSKGRACQPNTSAQEWNLDREATFPSKNGRNSNADV